MNPAITVPNVAAEEFEPLQPETLEQLHVIPPQRTVEPFAVWTPQQFVEYQDSKPALLGDQLLAPGEWTSCVGIGGLGKTRIILYLCICQITGKEWCGLKTGGIPQRILFLSTENGIPRYKADFSKMLSQLTDAERELIETHFFIPPLTAENDMDLCLGDPVSVGRIEATIRNVNPGIIVFDPWADMVAGDENKSEDVRDTLRTLRQILIHAAPDAAVLVIAHARTGSANVAQAGDNFSSGNFARGAKALFSKVRAEIQIAPGDRDDDRLLLLACGKNNNGPKFKTRGIIFDPDKFTYTVDPAFDLDSWRADVAGKRSPKSVTIEDVVEAVRELAPMPGSEVKTGDVVEAVKDQVGGCIRTIKQRIKEGKEHGYLRDGQKRGLLRLGAKPLQKR